MKILAISGSLRQGSYNTALVQALAALAPEGVEIEIADLRSIPLYNGDLENSAFPPEAQAFKERILGADALIIATPEYNRGVPGVLKNAIDWASRPTAANAFKGKTVLVAGVSSGKIGTAVAQSHLKGTLIYLDARVVGQPELYLGPAKDLFDEARALTNEDTKEFLRKALATLVERAGKSAS